jgi:hypothetical protein
MSVPVLFFFPDVMDRGSPRFGQAIVLFDLIFAMVYLPLSSYRRFIFPVKIPWAVEFSRWLFSSPGRGLHSPLDSAFFTAIRCSWPGSLCAL